MEFKYTLIIFLLSLCSCLYAQTEFLINEQFEDNRNKWQLTNTPAAKSYILGSKMHMEYTAGSGAYRFWRSMPISTRGDFEIEVKFTKLRGAENEYNGIVWGASDWANAFYFDIAQSGYFRLWTLNNEEIVWIKQSTPSRNINQRGTNLLKIKKQSGQMFFYINSVEVFSMDFQEFYGTYSGFIIAAKSRIAADFITVKQDGRQIAKLPENKHEQEIEEISLNIGAGISEIAPVVSPDGTIIYTARSGHSDNLARTGNYDIWYAELQADKSWGKFQNIGSPLNNAGNNVVIAVSENNKVLLLEGIYNLDGSHKSRQGVSVSYRKTTGGWTVPQKLEIKDYYNLDSYESFSISNDKKVLIMSIKREDSYGAKDLYVSFLQADGTYGKPANMGSTINSYGDELSPHIDADNKTLYFSSHTEPGYGSADIFVTKRLDESWTKWSKAQNVGSPVNTASWEAYYYIDEIGGYAYFVSTDNDNKLPAVYRTKLLQDKPAEEKKLPIISLHGKVYNAATGIPLSTSITITELPGSRVVSRITSNPQTGEYRFSLSPGKTYQISASKENFLGASETIHLDKISENKLIERNLELIPLEKDKTITLKNVNFKANESTLLQESFPTLNSLSDLMHTNPNLIIEIHGHTEPAVGYEEQLNILSLSRTRAVKEYLTERGIAEDRIKEKAFGGTKPVVDRLSRKGDLVNRRVEFKVLQNH